MVEAVWRYSACEMPRNLRQIVLFLGAIVCCGPPRGYRLRRVAPPLPVGRAVFSQCNVGTRHTAAYRVLCSKQANCLVCALRKAAQTKRPVLVTKQWASHIICLSWSQASAVEPTLIYVEVLATTLCVHTGTIFIPLGI